MDDMVLLILSVKSILNFISALNPRKNKRNNFNVSGEHYKGYQYMDGVPYVTQCPILPEAK